MITFIKRNDIPNKEGKYAIRMRVTKDAQRKYFAMKMFADDSEWDVENECFVVQKDVRSESRKADNERRKKCNLILSRFRIQAQEVIDDFQRERTDWTLNQFADAFLNKDKQGKGFDPRKLLAPGYEAIKGTVKEKLNLFGSAGKAE